MHTSRWASTLRSLIESKKTRGERLGCRGKLTQEEVKTINYCGYVLQSHTHNVSETRKAVQVTLWHVLLAGNTPQKYWFIL